MHVEDINKGVDIKSFVKVHAFMKAISKNDAAKKVYVYSRKTIYGSFSQMHRTLRIHF